MAHTTLEDALQHLDDACEDVRADMGEEAVDAGYADIVEAVAYDCTPAVRRELMRVTGVDR